MNFSSQMIFLSLKGTVEDFRKNFEVKIFLGCKNSSVRAFFTYVAHYLIIFIAGGLNGSEEASSTSKPFYCQGMIFLG